MQDIVLPDFFRPATMLLTSLFLSSGCAPQTPATQTLAAAAAEVDLSPDIVAELQGPASIANGTIEFTLKFSNIGSAMPAEAMLYSKAFLVPKLAYQTRLSAQGLVLPTFAVMLNLPANATKTETVSLPLPTIAAGSYFLGVTINSKAARLDVVGDEGEDEAAERLTMTDFVPESIEAQENNVTAQMLDLGVLAAFQVAPVTGKYDLYHEVVGANFDLNGNMASHRSRNILRVMEGDDEIPEMELWDDEISARFLFIDPAAGTLALGRYTSFEVDKIWTAISWGAELDQAGRNIHVDYYSNAPIISKLNPGQYVLGVLMNVTDGFSLDSYPANNLDLTFLDLSTRRILGLPKEIWMNINSDESTSIYASVEDVGDEYSWTYSIANKPDWLNVVEEASPYNYSLYFSATSAAPYGMTEFDVLIEGTRGGVTHKESTKLIVVRSAGPMLEGRDIHSDRVLLPTDRNVSLADRDGVRYMTVEFGFANVGNQELFYSLANYDGTLEGQSRGAIAPGQENRLKITIPLVGIAIPRDDGGHLSTISLSVSTNNGTKYVSMNFDAKAMLQYQL